MQTTRSILVFLILVCAPGISSDYHLDSIISRRLLLAEIKTMRTADSIILLNVDRSRINRGITVLTKEQRADSLRKKTIDSIWSYEKSLTYFDIPFSKKITLSDLDSMKYIAEMIRSNIGYRRKALAACQNWIGSIIVFNKRRYFQLDFESQNGKIFLYKKHVTYAVNVNPVTWKLILDYAIGMDTDINCDCGS